MPRASGLIDRSEATRKREIKKIETYKGLVEELQSKVQLHECIQTRHKDAETLTHEQIQAQDYSADTLVLTSNLLTQNPEYYTVWNNRRLVLQDVFIKELAAPAATTTTTTTPSSTSQEPAPPSELNTAQQEILLLIKEDLAFLIPLLKNFPKCYWIWNHRAWLLQQASEHLPVESAKRLWQGELGLVSKMLSMDSRNFHGWSYRRTVIRALETCDSHTKHQSQDTQDSMTEHEFAYTTKMIKTNLSNFSAWHNRLQLIPKLLRERHADGQARRKLLDDEFDFILQALYTDPYDQSLWFYHNWIMSTLSPDASPSSAIVLDLANEERIQYLELQMDTIKDILDGSDDCKYIYQALLTYSAQYLHIEPKAKHINATEMNMWLDQLEKLDPLRKGRWQDLRSTLKP